MNEQESLGGEVKMNYWTDPYGKTIRMMNSRPINYSQGGTVKWKKGQYNPLENDLTHDNMPVLLEIGSLVIPRSVVNLVRNKYGELRQPQVTNPAKLTVIIIMPEEYIVPAKHARVVKEFMRQHGITLPLPPDELF